MFQQRDAATLFSLAAENPSFSQAMVSTESEARALEVGAPADFVEALKDAGIGTYGQMAFVCSSDLSASDDITLLQEIATLLNRELLATEKILIRRLWFESRTLCISELKARVERGDDETPRKLPLAERVARLEDQRSRLPGVVWDSHTEPAHRLLDHFMSMVENGVLTYVAPNKCSSRSAEIAGERHHPEVSLDASGNIKLSRKQMELECSVDGDLKLRQAFLRRSLAMDQSRLASYMVMEQWHSKLFQSKLRDPPTGCKFVSTAQILQADRFLWEQLSQETRGKLVVGAGPPLDAEITKWSNSPEVLAYLQPLPAMSNQSSSSRGPDAPKRKAPDHSPAPSAKGGSKMKPGSGGEKLWTIPEGCVRKTGAGKPICFKFQTGQCPFQKKPRCRFGMHVCWYKGCEKARPYAECQH